MRVCLTNPCWRKQNKSGIRSGSRVPNIIGGAEHTFVPFPFPLAYTASYLESCGVNVLLIDAVGEEITEEEYYRRIEVFKPHVIINEISTASYRTDLAVINKLRATTNTIIVVCGPHPSALPAETLKDCSGIDAVFIGEMEETALEFVNSIDNRREWEKIDGLAFRAADDEILVNRHRKLIEDIDRLPYPMRKKLPLKKYCVAGFTPPVLFMYGSRGCPYSCNFCLWPQTMSGAGKFRARKPVKVVEEIRSVFKEFGPFGSIYFDDDTFNIGRERMFEFVDAMKTLPFKIPWGCNARAELFDKEILKALAEVGLFCVRIGIESGDPEILRRAKKNLDLNAVRRCIDDAHKTGVSVHVSYTIGLPGESWKSVKRTVAFARSISPDSVAFTITTPYPGTSYYDEVVKNNFLLTRDWDQFNSVYHSVIRTETLSPEEIVQAERYVMRKIYYTPSYIYRRFRYAANVKEIAMLARKGLQLFLKR
jgi:radical SAM superfamily enzyme YgiQ (UPF0313 family)